MPKTTGAETLEKFILEKNRARLGQERTNIEKRLEHIDNEISLIEGEIEELNDKDQQNEDTIINSVNNKKQEYHKKMKRMSMDY
jgi:predicted  nucleic acid-binding Zn-ribbon protein